MCEPPVMLSSPNTSSTGVALFPSNWIDPAAMAIGCASAMRFARTVPLSSSMSVPYVIETAELSAEPFPARSRVPLEIVVKPE